MNSMVVARLALSALTLLVGTIVACAARVLPLQGTATDVFAKHPRVRACEIRIAIDSPDHRSSMTAITAILSARVFLPRWQALTYGRLAIQVGAVSYGPNTVIRAVANRKCSAGLKRVLLKEMGRTSKQHAIDVKRLSLNVVGSASLPVVPAAPDLDLGRAFRLYQHRYRPSQCTVELFSEKWTIPRKSGEDDPSFVLAGKVNLIIRKYRLPILSSSTSTDVIYILAYDYCGDLSSVARDYLAAATLEGVQIPSGIQVRKTTLTDDEVASIFAFDPS